MKAIFLIAFTFAVSAMADGPKGKPRTQNDLTSPRWVYEAVTRAFPELREHVGGFSYKIQISELTCVLTSALDLKKNGQATVSVGCNAKSMDGKVVNAPGSELMLTLINSGLVLDRESEPGTTYIQVSNLDCSVIDPRPGGPDGDHAPRYRCSVGN